MSSELNLDRVKALQDSGVNRIYLAGPMSGYPQFNFPEFDRVSAELRAAGFDVVSPAELDDDDTREAALESKDGIHDPEKVKGQTWEDFLARDIILIADHELHGVIALPGWTRSRGANFEAAVAKSLAKPVVKYPSLSPVRHKPRLPFQQDEED